MTRYMIRENFFHLGEDSTITDESGNPVYQVDGKVLSLHNTLVIRDMQGNQVAQVDRKLLSFVPTYEISVDGHQMAEVRKHFFTPFGDRFTIDVPGPNDLEMDGNLLEHNFVVKQGGETVATVSKHWVTLTATYGVDIEPGQNDLLILTSVLALDLAEDAERNS